MYKLPYQSPVTKTVELDLQRCILEVSVTMDVTWTPEDWPEEVTPTP